MTRRVGLVVPVLLLLSALPVGAGHPLVLFDASQATPGVRLELSVLPSPTSAGPGAVKYRLRAEGVPRGLTFGIWAKNFGQPFQELTSGFRVDAAGVLVRFDESGQPQRLETVTLTPGPYQRGAAWEVALVSLDRSVKAFVKVIPNPITARQGTCSVSLELASRRGDRFIATGTGFAPGDNVFVESTFSGRMSSRRQRASVDGQLPQDLIFHAAFGTDRSARYIVKGRSCEVTLEYEWGELALQQR